VVQED